MMSENTPSVTGVVILDAALPAFVGASLNVRVEDVNIIDTAATVVAQQAVLDVAHEKGHTDKIPFDIGPIEWLDETAEYNLRAHVDMDGDGTITLAEPGDLITTESYPVLTFGHPADGIEVQVKEIK